VNGNSKDVQISGIFGGETLQFKTNERKKICFSIIANFCNLLVTSSSMRGINYVISLTKILYSL